jgi:cytidyltransferase-like protein
MRIIKNIDGLLNLPGKQIAFFGGAFDPPHFGHLEFIKKARSIVNFNHVIICPHAQNEVNNISEIKHRLRMMDMIFETPILSEIYVLSSEVCYGLQNQIFIDDIFHVLKRRGKEIFVLLGCSSIEACAEYYKSMNVTFIVGCQVQRSDAEKKLLSKRLKCIFIDDIYPCSVNAKQQEVYIRNNYLSKEIMAYIESNKLYGLNKPCDNCN